MKRCACRPCQKLRVDAVNALGVQTRMCDEHMRLFDKWRDESEAKVNKMKRRFIKKPSDSPSRTAA